MDKTELKERKGFDFVGVTVSYFCHDGAGNYVLSKRGKNCRDEHGAWDFGGGGVEVGDSLEETLRKEIKEEYCATIKKFEFLGHRESFRTIEGKPSQWVHFHYLVELDRNEVKNGEPHKFDEVAWFRLDTLPTPLHSQTAGDLEHFKDKLPH